MKQPDNLFGYSFKKKFSKPAAYFSMEFAIDQSLKIYSGGLGFLAGSHMRSAYELKQNLVGIGILWKYGYYDQARKADRTMRADFIEKNYSFLEDTGINFTIQINGYDVVVKALLLRPETFNTAPIFLLTTDLPDNDFLARTITHRLYDNNEETRIAQSILLGVGGAKLLDILNRETEIYHLNEGHALPLCFYLLGKYKGIDEVKKRVVFTTHTPEKAGNEEHDTHLLERMGFFQNLDDSQRKPYLLESKLNYTLTALRHAKRANAVSKLHAVVSNKMWSGFDGIAEIIPITNSQNATYWMDKKIKDAYEHNNPALLVARKLEAKRELFKVVADQSGKLFDENVLTIVWARRFAAYKRANLILRDFRRFLNLVNNLEMPVQIIWAGKPYPEDHQAIEIFNDIFVKTKEQENCAVLTGYELGLSALLKKGSDVWLNTPTIYHEASGTSGMTAAMNGSVNLSIADGWIPEFAEHGKNSFLVKEATGFTSQTERNDIECSGLLSVLEDEVLPMYYRSPAKWTKLQLKAIADVLKNFDSNRMAEEYFDELYNYAPKLTKAKTKIRKAVVA